MSSGFALALRGGPESARLARRAIAFGPPRARPKGDSSGGWGLVLVDRIAERWGVCPAPAGTCVWFEVAAGLTT